jgi:hypothetical protein
MNNFQGKIDEIRDREIDEPSKLKKTKMLTLDDHVDVLQTSVCMHLACMGQTKSDRNLWPIV